MPQSQLISYGVAAVIVVLILARRLQRGRRVRPLKLEQMWLLPTLYVVIVAGLMLQLPPAGSDWAWCAVALAVGAALGWYSGRLIALSLDPATRTLNQQSSPMAVVFVGVLVLARIGLRTVLAEEAQAWHLRAALIVDSFLCLALGLIVVQRLEVFLRGRRLLATARSGGPTTG